MVATRRVETTHYTDFDCKVNVFTFGELGFCCLFFSSTLFENPREPHGMPVVSFLKTHVKLTMVTMLQVLDYMGKLGRQEDARMAVSQARG